MGRGSKRDDVPPKTFSANECGSLTAKEAPKEGCPLYKRPSNRTQCVEGHRPCLYVSCRYNLFLDVTHTGSLRLNFPGREPGDMPYSCALDIANGGPHSLEDVGMYMNMTRERIRQIEAATFKRIRSNSVLAELFGNEYAVPEAHHQRNLTLNWPEDPTTWPDDDAVLTRAKASEYLGVSTTLLRSVLLLAEATPLQQPVFTRSVLNHLRAWYTRYGHWPGRREAPGWQLFLRAPWEAVTSYYVEHHLWPARFELVVMSELASTQKKEKPHGRHNGSAEST